MPPLKIAATERAMKAMKLWRPIWSGPRKRAATTETTSTKICGPTTLAALQVPPRSTAFPVAPEIASLASVLGKPVLELFIPFPQSQAFPYPPPPALPVVDGVPHDPASVAAAEERPAQGLQRPARVPRGGGGEGVAEDDAQVGRDRTAEAPVFIGQLQVLVDLLGDPRGGMAVAGVH